MKPCNEITWYFGRALLKHNHFMHAIACGENLNCLSAHKYISLALIILTLDMRTHSTFLVKNYSSSQAGNNLKII